MAAQRSQKMDSLRYVTIKRRSRNRQDYQSGRSWPEAGMYAEFFRAAAVGRRAELLPSRSRFEGKVVCSPKGRMARPSGDSSNPLLAALEELESALAEDYQLFAPTPKP